MRFVRVIWGVSLSLLASLAVAQPTFNLSSHVGDHWTYELSNPGAAADQYVYDIVLHFGVDVQNISSPSGWDASTVVGGLDWFSNDLSSDLAPDGVLDGFSFDAPGAIEQSGLFDATFWDHSVLPNGQPGAFDPDLATTVPGAADVVPEPATCATLALGAMALLRRRRKLA